MYKDEHDIMKYLDHKKYLDQHTHPSLDFEDNDVHTKLGRANIFSPNSSVPSLSIVAHLLTDALLHLHTKVIFVPGTK